MAARPLTILAIETSCDDTAAAVVRGTEVLSNVISSQTIHDVYGGIVPELASREHVAGIAPIVRAALAQASVALSDVDLIAVTNGPGLAGSLLVGTQFAKGLSMSTGIPVVPVNHIEAHLYSGHLEDTTIGYPAVCLVVSGGHTSIFHLATANDYTVLGSTKDDAAGEAFDKIAKLLGLGYPGGPHVDRLARVGNPEAFDFPRALVNEDTYDFSFSGLKTAVRQVVDRIKRTGNDVPVEDICASAQAAIVDVLVHKTMRAAQALDVAVITVAGGVSANSALRKQFEEQTKSKGIKFVAPRMELCVDNAAMIAHVAALRHANGATDDEDRTAPFGIAPKAIRASKKVTSS